jgi:RNA polymerase sigma factor (sigma-70 family)
MDDPLQTSISRVARMTKDATEDDWRVFYDKYKDVIISFCKKQGIDEFSAHDVLQETMVLLMRKLPGFEYNPQRGRFRNWLLTLVFGKVRDAQRRALRAKLIFAEQEVGEKFETSPAVTCPATDALENAWNLAVIEEALRRIKEDFEPQTLAIFEACVVEGLSAPEIALRFGVQKNAVYQIKNRLGKRLKMEVAALNEPLAGDLSE